ncbi:MAG: polysaccharide biosynthesis/export family protein [Planctomycetota bacterium]
MRVFTALALVSAMAAMGCSSSEQEVNAFLHEWEATVSAAEYRIQPPDEIEISSDKAPEIDGEQQTVRQDGKVSLRLLGDVAVAGLTPAETSAKLESLLSRYYVDPHVNTRVKERLSKRYYVFGQVGRPGAHPYTGRDSLLHVLSIAQPTFLAWKSQVKVIHPSHEESDRKIMTVNVDLIMKQGRLEQNVLLEEGDIVYVPATPMAWLGLRLREVLWPVSPILGAARTPAEIVTTGEDVAHGDTYRSRD